MEQSFSLRRTCFCFVPLLVFIFEVEHFSFSVTTRTVDGVLLANGEGDSIDEAKENAACAAARTWRGDVPASA